jgi:hypothetical protein
MAKHVFLVLLVIVNFAIIQLKMVMEHGEQLWIWISLHGTQLMIKILNIYVLLVMKVMLYLLTNFLVVQMTLVKLKQIVHFILF